MRKQRAVADLGIWLRGKNLCSILHYALPCQSIRIDGRCQSSVSQTSHPLDPFVAPLKFADPC